jgi:hypothetical protein
MVNITEEEWRALIERLSLSEGTKAEVVQGNVAPAFDDPRARNRVGDLITRAVLGEPLYRLYCGEAPAQP